jgi:hypothetical protein
MQNHSIPGKRKVEAPVGGMGEVSFEKTFFTIILMARRSDNNAGSYFKGTFL